MVIVTVVIFIVALCLIWKGSDWITDSLIPVAEKIGTSYVAVTTLLVSFVLSIPEIFAAIYTFLLGYPTIGLGVLIGSVMANIGLTVGVSAVIKPLLIEEAVVIRDGIFLVAMAGVVLLLGADLSYTRSEGLLLLLLFVPYALNVWYFEKHKPHAHKKQKAARLQRTLKLLNMFPQLRMQASIATFFLGALLLILGSYLFSYTLIEINTTLHFPEILLGLTIGALGPAMPNIIAAIDGTRKGLRDAALTETFGSNIFTLLITLGLMIILSPVIITPRLFYFDLTWMIMIHLLMIAFIFKGIKYKEASLTRYEGVILILFYAALILLHVFI